MAAFYCRDCQIKWPPQERFQPCARCGQRVMQDWMAVSLDVDEAEELQRAWRFEHFYREWTIGRFVEELDAF